MPVSSSSLSGGTKGGNVSIIYQGQTQGEYGNDPFVTTKQSQSKATKDLKP
jgi:hypothetical protein